MAATLLNDQENKDMPGRAKGGKITVRAGPSQLRAPQGEDPAAAFGAVAPRRPS
jgi:hypothetical protein